MEAYDYNWWGAVLFVVGSVLFVVGSVLFLQGIRLAGP
jgi:hypothetical protein